MQMLNKLINKENHDKYKEDLLRKRIECAKQKIVDYVMHDYFNDFSKIEDE